MIEEEVYDYQLPGFEDPDFPDRVYKVEKTLYRLHQAPRAWYETLSTYLLDNGFWRGKIDKTLFIRRDKGDILLVQVYVNGIIFGSTKKSLYTEFEKIMHKKFQMSSMGELTFFLGLLNFMSSARSRLSCKFHTWVEYVAASSCCGQVLWIQNQLLDYGYSNEKKLIQMIRIHTDKNVADLLTKAFDVKTINGEQQLQALVDRKKIILTEATVRRDLQLEDADGVYCLPNATIFEELTRIGLKTFTEVNFSISFLLSPIEIPYPYYFAMPNIMKNLDSSGKFLMYPRFMQVFLDNQLEGMTNHNRIYIALSHTKKVFANMKRQGKDFSGRVTPLFSPMIRPKKPKRKDTEIPQSSILVENVADEAVYKEMDDSLERATTIATGLDVEQDRGNISKTQSKATPNEPSSIGTSSGGGPRRQDTMGDTIAQTRSENVSKFSNDLLLAGVNTPRSGEDSLQLKELIDFCTKLQQRVLDLENTKTAQAQEITSLKKRVKKLERKKKSRTHGLKRLYKVGLSARIDSSDDEATLGDQEDASKQGRKIHDIDVDDDDDITLDGTHFDIDPDMFGMHDLDGDEVFVETEEPVVNVATTTSTISVSAAKDLSDVDMTLAQALAELKSTKPKAVTTAATTTTTAVTRPKAKGLVIQEQEQASTPITSSKDKGKGIMVKEPLKMKKKDQDKVETDYELAQRLQAEEQEELTIEENETREESSSKRAGDELEQEPSKKQKVDDDKETEELKQCMEFISDDGDDCYWYRQFTTVGLKINAGWVKKVTTVESLQPAKG
ncbi:putative ribonuclease H-like domain-containing protein [Tanacetum coccineum]|uniref:Ribonuclease H-like domain-containing protein n=1 Tax=Tanacetum coccineum TaxID=301880 RepID=A0ABQ5CNU9_9ASTR